jgi:hypothetical protein
MRPPVTVAFLRPLASLLICRVTFLAMSLAIMKGTPDRDVVAASLSRSNLSILPLDRLMAMSAGFFLAAFCRKRLSLVFLFCFFMEYEWSANKITAKSLCLFWPLFPAGTGA